jgi:hypothetical protein
MNQPTEPRGAVLGGPLSDLAARRLSNQIGRAFRGTFGARTGLRTIARSVAQQMLAAGSGEEAIALTFEHCILDHPGRLIGEGRNVLGGESHSRMLIELTRSCVAEAASTATRPAGG